MFLFSSDLGSGVGASVKVKYQHRINKTKWDTPLKKQTIEQFSSSHFKKNLFPFTVYIF